MKFFVSLLLKKMFLCFFTKIFPFKYYLPKKKKHVHQHIKKKKPAQTLLKNHSPFYVSFFLSKKILLGDS